MAKASTKKPTNSSSQKFYMQQEINNKKIVESKGDIKQVIRGDNDE
ncbi:MAG: hypothetical protein ACI8SC_002807 [Colwellia sp.]